MTGSTNDDSSVRLASMIRGLSSIRFVRFVVAPILSLWIAGAGCMIGCEGMVAAAVQGSGSGGHAGHHSGPQASIVASGHACSSSGSHSCCKKNAGEARPVAKRVNNSEAQINVGRSSSDTTNACPLAVSRAAIAAKTRTSEAAAVPAVAQSGLQAEDFPERTAPHSTQFRLLNRGHTYLRCCVFLI